MSRFVTKGLLVFMLPGFFVFAFAQQLFANMDQGAMQDMMKKLQEFQTCMENIDQSAIDQLQADAKQLEAEIKKLCASGDRSGAEAKAISSSRRISNSKALQDMKKCTADMQGTMDPVLPDLPLEDYERDKGQQHVCDSY